MMKTQNKSERIFERYLNSNGFSEQWEHEPLIPGKTTRPDYLLNYNRQTCFFEVKELRKKDNEPAKWPSYIDPYSSLREEINEARKQFKQFKDYSCSLVVFNIDDLQARLDPQTVLGAMLGNLGVSMDIDVAKGKAVEGTEKSVFLGGGKMINGKQGCPQNTTISSIVVLDGFLDNIEVEKAMKEEEKKQGKPLSGPEMIDARMKLYPDHPVKRVPRVVVVENPFARIDFPEGLFVGPFDERWRWRKENGKIERIFVGCKRKESEILKGKLEVDSGGGKPKNEAI
jgi:hypothetical protein